MFPIKIADQKSPDYRGIISQLETYLENVNNAISTFEMLQGAHTARTAAPRHLPEAAKRAYSGVKRRAARA
jgi:hypothetical protein